MFSGHYRNDRIRVNYARATIQYAAARYNENRNRISGRAVLIKSRTDDLYTNTKYS